MFQKASSNFMNEVAREESQSRLLVLEENKMQQLGLQAISMPKKQPEVELKDLTRE